MIRFLVALAFIVCGFLAAYLDASVLDKVGTLGWFVAAIAVNTLGAADLRELGRRT